MVKTDDAYPLAGAMRAELYPASRYKAERTCLVQFEAVAVASIQQYLATSYPLCLTIDKSNYVVVGFAFHIQ